MKYLCLVYYNEDVVDAMSDHEWKSLVGKSASTRRCRCRSVGGRSIVLHSWTRRMIWVAATRGAFGAPREMLLTRTLGPHR
jgi:hypothetical protein